MKKFLKTSDDLYLAILLYRTTPLPSISPAKLLTNHKLRKNLPTVEGELRPKIPDYFEIKKIETTRYEK